MPSPLLISPFFCYYLPTMLLSYVGRGCLSFTASQGVREADVRVVLDPFTTDTEHRFPRTLEADVVVVSQNDDVHSAIGSVQGTPFVVDRPGEYEVKGVMVDRHVAVGKDGVERAIVRLAVEDMLCGWLGSLDRPLTTAEADIFADIDALFLVLGADGMPTTIAVEIAQELEPRVIVAMGDASGVAAFRKSFGAARVEEVDGAKWKLLKKQLPQEETILVTLHAE